MPFAVALPEFVLAALLAAFFMFAMVRLHVLTKGGALMAALIGLAVIAGQGWLWLLPLVLFLASGVLLGRLNKNARTDAKHGKPRDAMQVFCSGGVYAVLAITADLHADMWMAVSICVAMCDTWASEIGMYARWTTVSIISWRKVPSGLSGGVSLPGTVGGLCGALVMAHTLNRLLGPEEFFDGFLIGIINVFHYSWYVVVLGAFAMGGMLLDSLLGALVQVKYNDGDGLRDTGTKRAGGMRWMTNDLVNLLSNVLVVGSAMWLL